MKLENLTYEILNDLYVNRKKSLQDIAALYAVSRTAVYRKLKQLGIQQRTKSEARLEAQKQQKLPQQFFDIDEQFFDDWSEDMAYILGLLFTDGYISKSGSIALCMNDKDLLEAVKNSMRSTDNIEPSKHQKNLYMFHFARERMAQRLESLGLIPNKSMVVEFPKVPFEYVPDFLRGVFDGDGSVFYEKRAKHSPLRAKFASSSEGFIKGLHENLVLLGMPARTIYRQKTKNGWYYMFVYGHKNSQKLHNILYKRGSAKIFLKRKFDTFMTGIGGKADGQ